MEEDVIKIDELEYFNPFDEMQNQFNDLIISDSFSCNLSIQHKLFLYLACCNNVDEHCKAYDKYSFLPTSNKPHPETGYSWSDIRRQYEADEWLDNKHLTHLNLKKWTCYTEKRAVILNKKIKQFKNKIDKYIKIVESYATDTNNTYKYLYKDKIPYIFHLQEIMRTFQTFNYSLNPEHKMFVKWHKLFKFKTITDFFNFQGYLGLLIINEFSRYYHNNQLNECIFCTIMMTNLCIYSPLYKRMEREKLRELSELRINDKKSKKQKSTAGSTTKNEKYKQYCIKYMQDNNLSPNKAADILANEFIEDPNKIRKKFKCTLGLKKKKKNPDTDTYIDIDTDIDTDTYTYTHTETYNESQQYDPKSTIYNWLINIKS